jgi:hypothetical protein
MSNGGHVVSTLTIEFGLHDWCCVTYVGKSCRRLSVLPVCFVNAEMYTDSFFMIQNYLHASSEFPNPSADARIQWRCMVYCRTLELTLGIALHILTLTSGSSVWWLA